MSCYAFKAHKRMKPQYVQSILDQYRIPPPLFHMNLRNRLLYRIPARISKRYSNSLAMSIIRIINQNYQTFDEFNSLSRFKFRYKQSEFKPYTRSPTTHMRLPIEHAKLLNRVRVGLLLNGHRFAHNFMNTPTPACPCGFRNQNEKHFLLECTHANNSRVDLLRTLEDANVKTHFDNLSKAKKVEFLLHGDINLTVHTNDIVIKATSKYIYEM